MLDDRLRGKNGQNKAAIFRFNPGKAQKVFPPKHPYYKVPEEAKKKVNAIILAMITESEKSKVNIERKRLKSSVEMPIAKRHIEQSNLYSKGLLRSRSVLDRFLSHCIKIDELDAAKYIWNNPGELRFVRHSPLGEVKDLTNPEDFKNISNKQSRGVIRYNTYEFDYNGKTWQLKLEEHKKGFEQFYSWYIEK